MCIAFIYRHITELPATQIFTTREVLIFGTRSGVDTALCRMVKAGFITRLARGVFVRDVSNEPSVVEIATAKAKAFGMRIAKDAEQVLCDLKLSRARANPEEFSFAKNGSSTSFETIHGRVHLKGVCARKLALVETKVGLIVYALWHLGSSRCQDKDIRTACAPLNRAERKDLWMTGSVMPTWLFEKCRGWYPRLQSFNRS